MTAAVRWTRRAGDGAARLGTLHTPHGPVATPAFMPVGTRATVRGLDCRDLTEAGVQMVLANTYHLMLRPGAAVVEAAGGLHRFMGWDRPILTDSGGYQVLSLTPRVDEEGVRFSSAYDGSPVALSPERAVRTQESLGADIAMQLDVPVALPAPRAEVAAAMERTLRWGERSQVVHHRPDQALFGIVQGGVDPELRAESARRTAALDFPGFAIGGLAVGESAEERRTALRAAVAELDPGRVRYVMGLGDPEGVLAAVEDGTDLFDCVWPTRLARHGRALTTAGDLNIRRAEYAGDDRPLDRDCACYTCRHHSRAYLRHLRLTGELTGLRLMTVHNVAYTMGLMAGARAAIAAGQLETYRTGVTRARAAAPE